MSERGDRQLRMRLAIAGAVALLVVAVGVAARVRNTHALTATASEQAVPTVALIQAKPAKGGQDALTLPASVQAMNTALIYARTTGYVRSWQVNIGQSVRRGQVLAILDAPEVDQQLAVARADLQTAVANANLARTSAVRWQAMLAKDAVSKQEADERQGDLAAKTAVAAAARADVARLQAMQGFTRLVAPFDGVVTTRSAEIGALVVAGNAASQPLFTIADVSRMRVLVRLPQSYSGQIRPGMDVELSLPEYSDRTFTARLVRSSGAVDPASGTVLVELEASNGDRALKPGAYAQAKFPLDGGASRLTLPPSALIIGAEGTQVALVGPDGKAVFRPVTLGRDFGKAVEINAGLTAADRVIDSPPDSLETGDPVRVLTKKAAANAAG